MALAMDAEGFWREKFEKQELERLRAENERRLRLALTAIGHRAHKALSTSHQPTSQMMTLHDMRFERDFLRAELQAISEMVARETK